MKKVRVYSGAVPIGVGATTKDLEAMAALRKNPDKPLTEEISITNTTDLVLHKLWTAHASGEYSKDEHKPLWIRLQKFVEENGGLHK